MKRRELLAAAGSLGVVATAGCSALGGDGDASTFSDGDWHTYGNGPSNGNRVSGGAPTPNAHDTLTSSNWPYGPPVVHRGIVYFATDRRVSAISLNTGVVWSKPLEVQISGAPALDPERGRLYVPTREVPTMEGPDPAPASVTGISISDGENIGAPRVGNGRTYGVTVFEDDVYVRSATACVRLAPDGTERWRQPLEPLVYDEYNLGDSTATQIAPAVTADGVYVPDRDALVKLDPSTGDERWRVPVDTPYAASVVDEGGVVQTGWQETVAVDHSGEERWRRDLQSRAAAAAGDGDIYVAAGDLHELDAETGETNWQAHLPTESIAAPVITDNEVLVAADDLLAFRRDAIEILGQQRKRWELSSVHAAAYSSPVIASGRVFVVGPAGLLALRPEADS